MVAMGRSRAAARRYRTSGSIKETHGVIGRNVPRTSANLKLALECPNRRTPKNSYAESLLLRHTSSEEMPNIFYRRVEKWIYVRKNKHTQLLQQIYRYTILCSRTH